jgi:hypothetical protein
MVTDSENFYHSILDLLEDPDENEEVIDLMTWWMWFVVHLINHKYGKLTDSTAVFFLIPHLHSIVLAKAVCCRKFGQNAPPCKNELMLTVYNLFILYCTVYKACYLTI